MTYSLVCRSVPRVDRKFGNGADRRNICPVRTSVKYSKVDRPFVQMLRGIGFRFYGYIFFFRGSKSFIYRVANYTSLTLSPLVISRITLRLAKYSCQVCPNLRKKQIIITSVIISCIWNWCSRDLAS